MKYLHGHVVTYKTRNAVNLFFHKPERIKSAPNETIHMKSQAAIEEYDRVLTAE